MAAHVLAMGQPRSFRNRAFRLAFRLIMTLSLMTVPAVASPSAYAQTTPSPVPGPCNVGPLPGGALALICIPQSGWNGDLIVFAHGYRAFNESLAFQNIELSDGTNLAVLAQSLGYAFAATTYRQNGLAILPALDDVRELVLAFRAITRRVPGHTYMTGASEGGLVTALLIERSPELFSGGLALCGPIGNFRAQVNYIGDFRVLFDFMFPGLIPGNALRIPDTVIRDWDNQYVPRINAAIAGNPFATLQLISTSKASIDFQDSSTVQKTVQNLLWYSTFSTNDAVAKLGGNPYGNLLRPYSGSVNDALLNQFVFRAAPDGVTLLTVPPYQTSGQVSIPLVTMHTIGDDIIPFWHEILYQAKAKVTGRGSITQIPIARYGHCNFTGLEALSAFGLLVQQVTGTQPAGVTQRLNASQVKQDYERAVQRERPRIPAREP